MGCNHVPKGGSFERLCARPPIRIRSSARPAAGLEILDRTQEEAAQLHNADVGRSEMPASGWQCILCFPNGAVLNTYALLCR